MTKIILSGCNGHMGQVIARLASTDESVKIVLGCDINTQMKNSFSAIAQAADGGGFADAADAVIDFSHPSNFENVVSYCKRTKTPLVMATTGLSDEQKAELVSLSESVAVFFSANMSLGVNLLVSLAKKAAEILGDSFDIEIIEKHHNQKIDAPSGTALMIADELSESLSETPKYVYDRHSVRRKRSKNEIGIHSVRGGTIVGEHDVIFAGTDEIVEIRHTAMSKEIFAAGSLKAAKFISGKKAGMYDMADIVKE